MEHRTGSVLQAAPRTGVNCGFCGMLLAFVHGHGQCVNEGCPQRGVNQEPCCQGESRQWTT